MNPGIVELLLKGCYDCTDTGVSWLAERCPTIVCLNVLVRQAALRCSSRLPSPPLLLRLASPVFVVVFVSLAAEAATLSFPMMRLCACACPCTHVCVWLSGVLCLPSGAAGDAARVEPRAAS
jgi:hypothetical protein